MDATAAEDPLGRGGATSVIEWKVVTVLCCRLGEAQVGSEPQESEASYRWMHAIYALIRNAVQRYGGTLQPLVGERITEEDLGQIVGWSASLASASPGWSMSSTAVCTGRP